jgi:hypothetical protein
MNVILGDAAGPPLVIDTNPGGETEQGGEDSSQIGRPSRARKTCSNSRQRLLRRPRALASRP